METNQSLPGALMSDAQQLPGLAGLAGLAELVPTAADEPLPTHKSSDEIAVSSVSRGSGIRRTKRVWNSCVKMVGKLRSC